MFAQSSSKTGEPFLGVLTQLYFLLARICGLVQRSIEASGVGALLAKGKNSLSGTKQP